MSSTQVDAEKQPLNVPPSNTVHRKKHKIRVLITYTIKSMPMTYIYIYARNLTSTIKLKLKPSYKTTQTDMIPGKWPHL